MGSACSACSDTSTAENQRKDRLLGNAPEQRQHSPSDAEGIPDNSKTSLEEETQPQFKLDKVETLFEDLAKFIRDLPEKSKGHVWGHSVKRKENGAKVVCTTASDEQQITKLLTDVVIVYVKYLDRKQKPLATKQVKPYVQPAAQWMFETYGALEQQKFVHDKNYFADMLEAYQGRQG